MPPTNQIQTQLGNDDDSSIDAATIGIIMGGIVAFLLIAILIVLLLQRSSSSTGIKNDEPIVAPMGFSRAAQNPAYSAYEDNTFKSGMSEYEEVSL